jgi:hypothetical protein
MNTPRLPIRILTVFAVGVLTSLMACAAEPPTTTIAPSATNTLPEHVHVLPTNAIAAAKAAGFGFVSFETLAGFMAELKQTATGPELTGKIPDEVLALSGKPKAIAGVMLPQKTHEGRVTEFLLLKETSKCCQGGPPKMNEWVIVRKKGSGVEVVTDRLLVVAGELTVGEYRENGRLRAIYRMDAEKIFVSDEDKTAH